MAKDTMIDSSKVPVVLFTDFGGDYTKVRSIENFTTLK